MFLPAFSSQNYQVSPLINYLCISKQFFGVSNFNVKIGDPVSEQQRRWQDLKLMKVSSLFRRKIINRRQIALDS